MNTGAPDLIRGLLPPDEIPDQVRDAGEVLTGQTGCAAAAALGQTRGAVW